jgi:hypothetical protein
MVAYLSEVLHDLLIHFGHLILDIRRPVTDLFLLHLLSTQFTNVVERSPRPVMAIPIVVANVVDILFCPSPTMPIANPNHVLLVYA